MSKWVLIDVSFLAYRAMHSVGYLDVDDVPTGVIFGFFRQLRSVCEDAQVRSNKVVLFFDSDGRKSFRKKAFPAYKEKRHVDREEEEEEVVSRMWSQVRLLRRTILPNIGFQCLRQTGLESDDLLAQASRNLVFAQDRGVIVTSDQDLYQCINQSCDWFNPQRKLYYTARSFEHKHGIYPGRWGEVKTLAGCKSDCVPGIPGVGEKTAIKHLLGVLPEKYRARQKIESKEGQAIAKRNKALVVLPHRKTKTLTLKAPNYDFQAFLSMCEEYELRTFLNKERSWRKFFLGEKTRKRKNPQMGLFE